MPLFTETNSIIQAVSSPGHRPELAGEVDRVLPESPADRAGVQPGDLVSRVNGHQLEDVIDVQFYAAEPECVLTIQRDGKPLEVTLDKHMDQQTGIVFKHDLFDGIRLCRNRCDFCFVDQQPKGMRASLQIRDDDYRLSFLHGNFVTLTNLTDYDRERIFRQRLSPLYVTVHATDNTVRRRLLRNKNSRDILEEIRDLVDGGIQLHTQIVLCQGMNDGQILDRTIEDLAAFYPEVQTLAVVPMGVTDYRLERNESDTYGPASSRKLLKQVRRWQRLFEDSLGTRFVYPSDEFYLLAGMPLPKAYTYEGFAQLSNGLGGSRLFLDELASCRRRMPREIRRGRVQLVTGVLAAPLIQRLAGAVTEILGYDATVVATRNNWYGHSTTVTGLLTGRDVRDALNLAGDADLVLLPRIMLREDTELFLDNMTVDDLRRDVGRPVMPVSPWPWEAIESLRDW